MKFSRPAWVGHHDPSANTSASVQKRPPIYSVHVHPDGSRIATGGQDSKVRIWSTRPILNAASEESNKPPKMLCTLSSHSGAVLCVRWAYSGRWLASGSDDTVIMIWDLDPTGGGRVWGSDEVNVEGWKPLKRLPGHDSDVVDLAWAPNDRYLASVSLDLTIIIWCGYSLERLHRISEHDGFVKGVCWDPVCEFFATASDDRSVKIWRTSDWGLEASVTTPFEDSPGSTFFRRLSWSPDGAHITASNATNQKGLVFIATVILRESWTTEISLVGHENAVEVATCNPRIFLREASGPTTTANICSVVALGSEDLSVSVWQTKAPRPVIVAKSMFERAIMDLAWSKDGMTLYAVSQDGTMGVFAFEAEELGGIASYEDQKTYLRRYAYQPPPVPQDYVHPDQAGDQSEQQPNKPSQPEVINTLVAKRKDKRGGPRRVNLTSNVLPNNIPSASTSRPISRANGLVATPRSALTSARLSNTASGVTTEGFGFDDVSMDDGKDTVASIVALNTASPTARRRSPGDAGDEGRLKARTLGGDKQREVIPVRELAGSSGQPNLASMQVIHAGQTVLSALSVLTVISARVNQGATECLLEGKNSESGLPSEIACYSGRQTQWLDYVPAPIIAVAITTIFGAVAMQDGTLNVYSLTGRRLMPTVMLGSPCSYLCASEGILLALTSAATLYAWNIKKGSAVFAPLSVAPLLSPNTGITSVSVRPNGAPVIQLSSGVAFTYDATLCALVQLADKWYIGGSDAWQARQRGGTANRGAVGALELAIAEGVPAGEGADTPRPEWWAAALTLGHLDGKMHAARLLDSPTEYKQALLVYAQRLASEGFRAKAEELVKELFGPLYWRPGKNEMWTSTVAGLSKRDLLKEVLNIFARSKTLAKLAQDWQDIVRKSVAEE